MKKIFLTHRKEGKQPICIKNRNIKSNNIQVYYFNLDNCIIKLLSMHLHYQYLIYVKYYVP